MSPVFPFTPARRFGVVCGVLFVGTLILFSRSLGNGFLDYDDPDYVTLNLHVREGLSWAGLRWAFTTGDASNWHPLTWLSHQLDWQFFHGDPRGPHATNVFLHACNAVLAFLALNRLSRAFWASAFSAAWFAWHPLRVESVAWIAERKDVLSMFFGLATLWAYARFVGERDRPAGRVKRWYGLAVALFGAGLLCKPMLVTLPCVLLLLDFWPLRRTPASGVGSFEMASPPSKIWARLLLEKIPFFLLAGASCVVTYHVQNYGGAVADEHFTFASRLVNAFVSIGNYLFDFFWPSHLAVAYPHLDYWPRIQVIGSVLVVGAVSALAIELSRARPWVFVGWAWFLGTLVPVIGLVQVGLQARADRYTYFPALGLEIALVWTLRAWITTHHGRTFAAVGGTAVLIASSVCTWSQEAFWRDSQTLFEHALAVTENNYLAHCYIATTLFNENRLDEAERHARLSVELKPDYAAARYGLGAILERRGLFDEALVYYREAVQLRPAYAAAREGIGRLLLRARLPDEAEEQFLVALEHAPSDLRLYFSLADAASQQHRPGDAFRWCEKALALAPENAEAQNRLANALVVNNRIPEALAHYEKALHLQPNFADAHCNYANQLRELGRLAEASEHYRQALALQPDLAEADYGLGVVFEEQGKLDEAAACYVRAIQLQPSHAPAQYNLGVFLLNRDQVAEAQEHFLAATHADSTFAEAYLALGVVEDHLGHASLAVAAYERVLELNPKNSDARNALAALRASSHPPSLTP